MVSPAMMMKVAAVSDKIKSSMNSQKPGPSSYCGRVGPHKRSTQDLILHSILCVCLVIAAWFFSNLYNFNVYCPDNALYYPMYWLIDSNGTWSPDIDTRYYPDLYSRGINSGNPFIIESDYFPIPGVDISTDPMAYYGDKSSSLMRERLTIVVKAVSRYYGGYTCKKYRHYYDYTCYCATIRYYPYQPCTCNREEKCCDLVVTSEDYSSSSYVDSSCKRASSDFREENEVVVTDFRGKVRYQNSSSSGVFYKELIKERRSLETIVVSVPGDSGSSFYLATFSPTNNPPTFVSGSFPTSESSGVHSGVIMADLGKISANSGIELRQINGGLYRSVNFLGLIERNYSVMTCEIEQMPCSKEEIYDFVSSFSGSGGSGGLPSQFYEYKLSIDYQNSLLSADLKDVMSDYNNLRNHYSEIESDISSKSNSFMNLGYIGWVFSPPSLPPIPNTTFSNYSGASNVTIDFPNLDLPACMMNPNPFGNCSRPASTHISTADFTTASSLDALLDKISPVVSYLSVADLISQMIWVLVMCIPSQLSAKMTASQKTLSVIRSLGLALALITPSIVFLSYPGMLSQIIGIGNLSLEETSSLLRLLCTTSPSDKIIIEDCYNTCSKQAAEWKRNVSEACNVWSGLGVSFDEKFRYCSTGEYDMSPCLKGCYNKVIPLMTVSDMYFILKGGWPGYLLSSMPLVLISLVDSFWFKGWVSRVRKGNQLRGIDELGSSVRREWLVRNSGIYFSLCMSTCIMTYSKYKSLLTFFATTSGSVVFVLIMLFLVHFSASRNTWLRNIDHYNSLSEL